MIEADLVSLSFIALISFQSLLLPLKRFSFLFSISSLCLQLEYSLLYLTLHAFRAMLFSSPPLHHLSGSDHFVIHLLQLFFPTTYTSSSYERRLELSIRMLQDCLFVFCCWFWCSTLIPLEYSSDKYKNISQFTVLQFHLGYSLTLPGLYCRFLVRDDWLVMTACWLAVYLPASFLHRSSFSKTRDVHGL
jgi:hypothetical protein